MKKYTINLDRERELRYDLNAMCAYEDATGKSAFAVGDGGIKASDVRALLWSCLIHEDKSLTQEDIGKYINTKNLGSITDSLNRLISDSVKVSNDENLTEKN